MRLPRCCPSPKRTDRPRTTIMLAPVPLCVPLFQQLHFCMDPVGGRTIGKSAVFLTFRISLFRTLQICWMSAADCETFSSELPNNCSSSFWFFDGSTSTPGCMTTLRTIFSPMKILCIPSALRPHFPSRLQVCQSNPGLPSTSRRLRRT